MALLSRSIHNESPLGAGSPTAVNLTLEQGTQATSPALELLLTPAPKTSPSLLLEPPGHNRSLSNHLSGLTIDTSAMEPAPTNLANLSSRLFQRIADYLSIVDLVKLGMTCMELRQRIDVHALLMQNGLIKEAMRVVDYRKDLGDEFACYHCIRILPKDRFAHAQCRDKTGSHSGRGKSRRMTRICMDCAVKTKFYGHLQPVKFRGARHYHCHRCGVLAPEAKRCKELDEPYPDMPILEIKTTVCFPNLYKPGEDLSELEELPRKVMKNIAKFLTYKDGLNLGMVSQWMHRVVKPAELVPIHERFMLTECRFAGRHAIPPQRAQYFPRRRRLPCFMCFRVRDKKHFSQRQVLMAQGDQGSYWRMRCKSCLQRMYIEGDKEMLERYASYDMCAECRCLKEVGRICMFCAEVSAVPDPVPVTESVGYSSETFHVGSYDERRGRSYLTEETFPLRKRALRWR